jgi:dihydroorotase
MASVLILNAQVINEGIISEKDILIQNGIIMQIAPNLSHRQADTVIDAKGKYLLPGVIDDQVHFREPGLMHKAEIYTEARAAVAGGTTTFMEMPNTVPNTLTQTLLEEKYQRAAQVSLANYSFFMGVSNDNLAEVLKTNPREVCGLKIFMGSSTGNMLVDNLHTLEKVFQEANLLIATHCEDEATIRQTTAEYQARFGEDIPIQYHPEIRSAAACLKSSAMAVDLAKKYNTRLHILHISTQEELALFTNQIPLKDKRITAEVCVHHLWFNAAQYEALGAQIKCNPAIKASIHQASLLPALLEDRLDIIATDHAPHTWDEKQNTYLKAPSGLPLVQHSLLMMLEFHKAGKISLEKIVEKMSHAPAICFQIEKRGFIREGYWADLVLVDLNQKTQVSKENLYYKCGWSPLEGHTFPAQVTHTLVSGHLVYCEGVFDESVKGKRILFERA